MLAFEPDIEYNTQYKLKIEWAGLNMNFTHKQAGQASDIFAKSDFENFMTNYYENNLRLIDVNYHDNQYVAKYFNDVDDLIHEYNRIPDNYCINFLAINPNETKKIVVREYHLTSFPKYFENWTLYPVSDHTTCDYNSELKGLIQMHYEGTSKWQIQDYLLMSILNFKARFIGIKSGVNQEVHEYILGLRNTYSNFYLNYIIQGPNQFREHNCLERLSNGLYNWFDTEYYAYDDQTPLLTVFTEFQKFVSGVQLFNQAFADFEQQNDLFIGMPFDLTNRRLCLDV
jgi:hypothetical protein